jgi:hypothetical protein
MGSFDIAVEMSGASDLEKMIRSFGDVGEDAFAAAVYLWSTNVMSTSMKLTPFDTGWLRQSRYVALPAITAAGAFRVEMGYSAPYAVFVHEINNRYIVGEWKFLEKAIDWHASSAMADIGRMTSAFIASRKGIGGIAIQHPTSPLSGPIAKPRRRKPGETTKAYRRRIKKIHAARAQGRADNEARMAVEWTAAVAAKKAGKRAPRPGRGGK